ncbi:MAG: hypothetical protein EOS10_01650 [Mesorhizobium sp.]|uniref:hypothetical protein n=1 Tax=Mesorhizobium sp. TaxID=1871066 RepID=UPI000FE5857D|nr:hypothetical protein [Mesorhizobium sp.]RWO35016.1 MAG: hypothetical protein EOS10_01650 [Mesorhizobium sp.]
MAAVLRSSCLASLILLASSSALLADETYRLVHAIDNDETLIKKGLTQRECRSLKADLIQKKIIIVEGEQEDPNLGVLACLPESAFQ